MFRSMLTLYQVLYIQCITDGRSIGERSQVGTVYASSASCNILRADEWVHHRRIVQLHYVQYIIVLQITVAN
jgi:hypothetical protein